MAARKDSWIRSLMPQFCYDHRKLDPRLTKIRKNADELAKMLDSMSMKKDVKKEK